MGNWWWAWFAVAVGLNLGAGVWNVLAARRHLRAAAAWRAGELPVGAAGADEAARKETSEWLWRAWKEVSERDQTALAELEARAAAFRKKAAAADTGLEDVRMPGPCLPPPPNPRPNPPDSGLDDEQWAQFLAKQRAETVSIDPAKTYKECFFNRGVFIALEAAFRAPTPLYSRESREYAEMVRAFWHLAPYFGTFWPDDDESSDG